MVSFTSKFLALLTVLLSTAGEVEGEVLVACMKAYPGTDHEISGKVTIRSRTPNKLSYAYKFSNAESSVTALTNVHAGTTCKDASQVGGLYAPGFGGSYTTKSNGRSKGSFGIETTVGLEDLIGHAVVVNDANGAPIGCGILAPEIGECPMKACIKPYPGTINSVRGTIQVSVDPEDNQITYNYKLNGLEPSISGAGTHIHAGKTCDDASLVGGHYWNATAVGPDPWTPAFGAVYSTNARGNAVGSFTLNSGYGPKDNLDHAVVVHASDGSRVGCGVLTDTKAKCIKPPKTLKLEACVSLYPGTASTFPLPKGKIVAEFDPITDEITYSYDLFHFETSVIGAGTHIHSGTTCDDATLVGGHYWNAAAVGPDPWTPPFGAVYSTDANGRAQGSFSLNSGYGYEENINHAVVVHASDGSRIGCGVLKRGEVDCR